VGTRQQRGNVGIGLSYAIKPDLQSRSTGATRSTTSSSPRKYVVIQQAAAVPFSIALRGGGDNPHRGWSRQPHVRVCAGDRLASVRPQDEISPCAFVTQRGADAERTEVGGLFTNAGNVPVGFASC